MRVGERWACLANHDLQGAGAGLRDQGRSKCNKRRSSRRKDDGHGLQVGPLLSHLGQHSGRRPPHSLVFIAPKTPSTIPRSR